MAPTPDGSIPLAEAYVDADAPASDDSIVITGMSGLMPGCRDLNEFADKLYNMENLADDKPRWKFNHPESAQYQGNVPDLDYFDAQFFMVNYRLGLVLDIMAKKLLEQSYQAIFDAGVSLSELSGKRIGVFISSCTNEQTAGLNLLKPTESSLIGSDKSMLANRISYWLNTNGPSYWLDAACCGSMVALEKAYDVMSRGHCDAAIVGGACLTLFPQTSIHQRRLMPLNPDGKTKSYDTNADGITHSEAITAFFLQKRKDARRVYAEIYNIKSGFVDGLGQAFVDKYGPHREPTKLSSFLHGFYKEAGVSPDSVEYVEGNGTGIPDADKVELQAIERVFCKEREQPLLVGSVTSNMGFADAASGSCSLVKLLLAYRRGVLAANLNCDNPRQDVAALQDGRIRIVTKHEQFKRSYAALNNFSVTGLNVHVLLKGHYKNKDVSRYHCEIPYLVTVSGRQESAVQKILDNIKTNELDPEEIALYHEIHKTRILKHMARGYGVYSTENKKTVALSEKVDYYDELKRPLWFVYSGMGSQWIGMGAQLMRIPIFAAAIERCDKVLKPKGVDIVEIITSTDKTIFDNLLNSFMGITAIQIGLTDVLRAVGLVPDKIIGHSLGELGCAYADGCCTTEEIILLSYGRGMISTQIPLIKGSMVAVGIGYKQISKMCPPEIDVACHNGPNSSTISGPVEAMREFVGLLTSRGIFAKEVKCSNIAYHSRYIAKAKPELLRYSKEVIKEPKIRSERWLSTSVEMHKWHEPAAKYSSAEYHTNNLLNPVLFEETLRLVPNNAVLVEVAPHGLLQAILKRSLPVDCQHVPLTKREHQDCVIFLLEALGKIYMEGYDIDISALYPRIEFPVSTQTRQLSHLVEWAHTEKWEVHKYIAEDRRCMGVYKPKVTIYDEDYKFLQGSVIEGIRRFPLAAALVFVWDTLSMITGMPLRETSVQFQNVKFHKLLVLNDDKPLRLEVMLQQGSGRFEITKRDMLVVEGHIFAVKKNVNVFPILNTEDPMVLNSSDIYKLLFERGYEYKNEFRVISCSNLPLTKAQMVWRNNWVTFIDGAIQMCTLRHKHNAVSQPQYIKCICIDVRTHLNIVTNTVANKFDEILVDATVFEDQNTIRCGGLFIDHIIFKDEPRLRQPLVLQTLKFIPFFEEKNKDITTTLYVFIQMIAENLIKEEISVLIIDNKKKSTTVSVLDKINSMLYNCSLVKQIDVIDVKEENKLTVKCCSRNPDAIILNHSSCSAHMLEALYHLFPNAFLITIGVNVQDIYSSSLYIQVSAVGRGISRLELARWKSTTLSAVTLTVGGREDIESLIVSRTNLQSHEKLVVLTSFPPPNGLKNLIKQWREEEDRNQIYLAMVKDKHKVDVKELPNFGLAFNIFNQNTWGGEYYLPLHRNSTDQSIVALQCTQLGDLNSLYWTQIPNAVHQTGGIKIEVHYAELNVYDAQRVLAQISIKNSPDLGFGMSFSGISESGEFVMGLMPIGAVSKQIWSRPDFLWPVPAHWSLEDAATVPLAYTIAFYCLGIKSRLIPGMAVLVHGGVGAVGQAVISIALANSCTVFTTVSDHHKKEFLRKLFPTLPANHIGFSRDDSFRDMVINGTDRKGCDIVISNVRGQLKHVTLDCCGPHGITLDLAQIHTQENFEYGMFHMTRARSYVTIDISSIFSIQNVEDLRRIRLMMSEGISRGYVRPLTRMTYAPHDVARAFRLLATSRHRGRVLLRMREHTPQAQPRLSCSPDVWHILLCDKDGFGINFADKLVERGVNKLYLNVPNISNYLLIKKQSWEKRGVEVRIVSCALDSIEAIRQFLEGVNLFGSIEGIYVIATGIHNNEGIVNINSEIYNLHVVSRELCPNIRYFVVITEDNAIGRDECLKRNNCELNSLLLQLKLRQFTDSEVKENKEDLTWSSGVEAVEKALLSDEAFVIANLQTVQSSTVFDEVTKIPGISLTSSTDDTITLEQAGVDQECVEKLGILLEDKFNIEIPKELVGCMTVGQLKNLKAQTVDTDKGVPCFSGYFSYIDGDEVNANCEIVFMPTLSHVNPDEYEENEIYLCIVPGMEGHHARFRGLCELLKLPAVVLQLGLDKRQASMSIQEIAQSLVDVLMKKLKIKNNFILLGYEFGVPIVLEMANIMESHGLTGTVYCLGGTPNDICSDLEHKINGMTEDTLQITLLQHLQCLILGEKATELDEKLRDLATFSDKVKYVVDSLRGRVPFSSQYIESLLEVAYSRIRLTRQCNTEFNILKSKIVIIRAMFSEMTTEVSWKYSNQDVIIHKLECMLDHAPQDLKCASLINNYLDTDILKKFFMRNRCELYIKNDLGSLSVTATL